MHKISIIISVLLISCFSARADHITGGEMYYKFTGIVNGLYNYDVEMKLFMRCNSGRQFNNPSSVFIFSRANNNYISDVKATLTKSERISITDVNPCISNPPTVCYDVGYFKFSISVPASTSGYYIVSQVNYRINTITNLIQGYSQVGATYVAEIPGSGNVTNGQQNTSAIFTGSDLVIVCGNNPFTYSFAAEDADGDQLSYSFCDAYVSGTNGVNAVIPPPPYNGVPYGQNFSGQSPLGSKVKIEPNTGLISGIAPSAGAYVVTVCVTEKRNGIAIATQRKDLQINIAPCDIAAAVLEPEYQLCSTSTTIELSNLSTSPLISSYYWEIKNAGGNVLFTSSDPEPSYTFTDTGLYSVKLAINKDRACSDSTSSPIRVYPGFKPAYTYTGLCINNPTRFTDNTTSVYGVVNSWNWDFGENTSVNDISTLQNPQYTYPATGNKNAVLTVTDSKGCTDSISKMLGIYDKPQITFPFKDTLICVKDSVQLQANGNGIFSWTPDQNIFGANTSVPVVFPETPTWYIALLNDQGCTNKDSILVRTTDKVALQVMNDTTICAGDSIRLRINSDGFKFAWTPAVAVSDSGVSNPMAFTPQSTVYSVSAFIGSCVAKDSIFVKAVPYPIADAGPDTTICFDASTRLRGKSDGTVFTWRPSQTLTPVAKPLTTTTYTLLTYDVKGCPKSSQDNVVITVLPDINAFAGNDTSVVIGQPLQLAASGGIEYVWSPPFGLSAVDVPNPVAIYNNPQQGISYKVNVYNTYGCVDSAYVVVKVFSTLPTIFVPTAFTPNGDGKNEVLRPIAVGIKQVEFFKVFNRWGQLVFSTTTNGAGWDGNISGMSQAAGTYVWMVKAIDFTGKPYFLKGVSTLIR